MSEDLILVVASYSDKGKADQTLTQLKAMQQAGTIDLIDAAVLVKNDEGKLKINELREFTPRKGLKRGAVVGGVLGVIFPPSLLVSAAAGGVVGGLIGRFTDQGMKNDELKAIGEELNPGDSAIVAIAEDRWIRQFEAGLVGYDKLIRQMLDADLAAAAVAESTEA